jgi:hypothetical protein
MVEKFAPLVKRQIEYWQWQIDRFQPNNPRFRESKVQRYKSLVADFTKLLEYLNKAEGTNLHPERRWSAAASVAASAKRPTPHEIRAPLPHEAPTQTQVADDEEGGLGNLSDLPPELLAELSEGAKSATDPLVKIIQDRGGTATLDEILVDLYRKYNELGKRTLVGNKLYRLGRRKLVWAVPGKKGVYTTTPVEGGDDEQDLDNEKGSDAETSKPSSSNDSGVAGSPGNSPKAAAVGSTPTTSTLKRKLMAETTVLPLVNFPSRKES